MKYSHSAAAADAVVVGVVRVPVGAAAGHVLVAVLRVPLGVVA